MSDDPLLSLFDPESPRGRRFWLAVIAGLFVLGLVTMVLHRTGLIHP